NGEDIQITGTIKNKGVNPAANYTIEIFNDLDFDSTGIPSELIFSQSFSNLQPNDSTIISQILNSVTEGYYQLIGEVTFNEDEDTSNNKIIIQFIVYPPGNEYNDIVVNEIMYAPASGE